MSEGPAPAAAEGLYHERQRLELCAVHALNNVLQQRRFTQEAADEICKRSLWWGGTHQVQRQGPCLALCWAPAALNGAP